MATFAELAGVQPSAHHTGISIVPTLVDQPDKQAPREYLYWEYHQGKQQAVRMGPWKGIRIGGTKEPIELYNLVDDIGEHNDVADEHPEIVKRIAEIMIETREGSEFNDFWPLPERRLENNTNEDFIFQQIKQGIVR